MLESEEQNSTSDVIREEIRNQSQNEAEAILAQGEKEALQILDSARAEAEKIHADRIQKAEIQAEGIRKKILSGVHLEVKRQTLRARESLLSTIFDKIKEKLFAFRQTEAYANYLKRLVAEGMTALDAEIIQVLGGDVERALLQRDFIKEIEKDVLTRTGREIKLKVSERILPEGGVVLVSSDEKMLFDNRLTTRMQRMRNQMRLKAVKRVME